MWPRTPAEEGRSYLGGGLFFCCQRSGTQARRRWTFLEVVGSFGWSQDDSPKAGGQGRGAAGPLEAESSIRGASLAWSTDDVRGVALGDTDYASSRLRGVIMSIFGSYMLSQYGLTAKRGERCEKSAKARSIGTRLALPDFVLGES